MKSYCFPLLLALCLGAAATADAKPSPGAKSKRAYVHRAESGQGKNNKARFRKESTGPVIDLHPHRAGTFKTAKAPAPYRYYTPR